MVFQQWKIGKIFAEEWCFSNGKNGKYRKNDMKREKGMKGMNDEMLLGDGEMSLSEGSNASQNEAWIFLWWNCPSLVSLSLIKNLQNNQL